MRDAAHRQADSQMNWNRAQSLTWAVSRNSTGNPAPIPKQFRNWLARRMQDQSSKTPQCRAIVGDPEAIGSGQTNRAGRGARETAFAAASPAPNQPNANLPKTRLHRQLGFRETQCGGWQAKSSLLQTAVLHKCNYKHYKYQTPPKIGIISVDRRLAFQRTTSN